MARRVTRNYRADEITEEQWEELIVDSDSDENVDPEVSVFEPRDEISESDVPLEQEWRERNPSDRAKLHNFTGPPPGLHNAENHNLEADSFPVEYFKLLFSDYLFASILEKTNRYARQTLRDDCKQPDITMHELHSFMAFYYKL